MRSTRESSSTTSDVMWQAACPACGHELGPLVGDVLVCPACRATFGCVDGTWRMIAAERQPALDAFLLDYTKIRLAEGRGSHDAAYYLSLPDPLEGDLLGWQWRMRATTWRHVCRRVLPRLGPGLRVLDLGSGVGWLSHRVAGLGHHPVAIDVSVDQLDGLGAARHFNEPWPRVQAEFDRLPIADGQADLVIFNASFHYSTDYLATLAEARRVTRPNGWVLIIDTPVYRRDESGPQMAAARHADFAARFGTRSESMPSIEYLSESMVRELSRRTGISWSRSTAWYGLKWWWRPHRARLKGDREPSRFVTLVGQWPDAPGNERGGSNPAS